MLMLSHNAYCATAELGKSPSVHDLWQITSILRRYNSPDYVIFNFHKIVTHRQKTEMVWYADSSESRAN